MTQPGGMTVEERLKFVLEDLNEIKYCLCDVGKPTEAAYFLGKLVAELQAEVNAAEQAREARREGGEPS